MSIGLWVKTTVGLLAHQAESMATSNDFKFVVMMNLRDIATGHNTCALDPRGIEIKMVGSRSGGNSEKKKTY